MAQKKPLVVMSGGMDSVTLAYWAASYPGVSEILVVSFNYGQRHKRELESAKQISAHMMQVIPGLTVTHRIIDMSFMAELLHGSALTSPEVEVPEGHYAADSMKATVVPNRNAIMASLAYGIAVAEKCTHVYLGVHAGDHAVYPKVA